MGTRRWLAQRLPALAVVVALVLGGCSDDAPHSDPKPRQQSGNETSEMPSEEPADDKASPPEQPEAMEKADEKGAIAAAEYYFELVNYAQETNDVLPLQGMSSRACNACNASLKVLGQGERKRWTTVGGRKSLSGANARTDGRHAHLVDATLSATPQTITDPKGKVIVDSDGDEADIRMWLAHDRTSGWRVTRLDAYEY